MPNPLDRLRQMLSADLPALPGGPPPVRGPATPRPPTPQVRDKRDVDPSDRLGVKGLGSQGLEAMGQAAHALGVGPELAGALAVTEGEQNFGMLNGPADPARQAERALMHLRERASAVGGSLEHQLQGYNGMGKLAAGHYGQDAVIDAGKDLPYGKRVLDVLDNLIRKSPEVQNRLHTSQPNAVSPLAGEDWRYADEIARDLSIRMRKPGLLK